MRLIGLFWAHAPARVSLLLLSAVWCVSLSADLWITDRAWLVHHRGAWRSPVLESRPLRATDVGQVGPGEARYRELATQWQGGDDRVWLAPYPYGPLEVTDRVLQGPTSQHWMGTDKVGRDVFARFVHGTASSLSFGVVSTVLAYGIGTAIGAVLGWTRGWADLLGQRLIETWSLVPGLLVLILIGGSGPVRLFELAALLAAFGWTGISRHVRAEVLRERSRDYVIAGLADGTPGWRVLVRHVLPNALSAVVSQAPLAFIGAVLSMTAVDFLGFGLPAPAPSWGELVAQAHGAPSSWHLWVFPFGGMFVTLALAATVAQGAATAADPYRQGRVRRRLQTDRETFRVGALYLQRRQR